MNRLRTIVPGGVRRKRRPPRGLVRAWRAVARLIGLRSPGAATAHKRPGPSVAGAGGTLAAITTLAAAAEADPRRIEPLLDLGDACLKAGRGDEAIGAFRRALAIDPGAAAAHRGLGAAYREAGARGAATASFRRAAALDPTHEETLVQLAELLQIGGDPAAALPYADAALALRPENAAMLALRARAALGAGRTEEAIAGLRRVLALDPENEAALQDLALLTRPTGIADPAAVPARSTDGRRVAVALGAGIGNMIQCTPAIRRLSDHLGHPVDVLLNEDFPGCAVLFEGAPWVGAVHSGFAAATRQRYDTVVVLASWGPLLPAFDADRVVADREASQLSRIRDRHEAEHNLETLRTLLGVPYRGTDIPRYFLGDGSRGVAVAGRIGVHAGCKPGIWDAKRWPYFRELAERLRARGYEIVSFGTGDEHVPGTRDATGTGLGATIAAMRSCSYVVANDSGLMHIADALGIPTTTIFAPTSIVKNGPLAATSRVVAIAKECAPCQFDRARLLACRCIAEIGVDQVLAAVLGHIAELGGGAPAAPEETAALALSRLSRRIDDGQVVEARHTIERLLASPTLGRELRDAEMRLLLAAVRRLGAERRLVDAAAADPGGMVGRHAGHVLAIVECAALTLETAQLDAFVRDCATAIVRRRAPRPVERLVEAARRYCTPAGLAAVLDTVDRSANRHVLTRANVAQGVGDALLGADPVAFVLRRTGLTAADFVAHASVERRVQHALATGDRSSFIRSVNAFLAIGVDAGKGAGALAKLLRNATHEVAAFGIGPGEIDYQDDDPRDDRLALAIVLNDAAAAPGPDDADALFAAWRTRRNDYGPLNAMLDAWLRRDGAMPLDLAGRSQAEVLRSCGTGRDLPDAEDRGLVSVILAAHDPDPVLMGLAVASVLGQTYRNLELIIVDDGSGAAAAATIAAMARTDGRVRHLRNPVNAGPYHCRNLALGVARGAFVAFHDADDVAHPQRLALQIARLAADDSLRLCFAAHMRFDVDGAVQLEVTDDVLSLRGDGPVTAVLRRETLDIMGRFAPVRSRGDTEMRARIAAAFGDDALQHLAAPLMYCAGGPASLSTGTVARYPELVQLFRRSFRLRAMPPVVDGRLAWDPASSLAIPYPLRATTPRSAA